MSEQPARDRSDASPPTRSKLVLAVAVVVAAITGVYAVTVVMATARGPEPPAELFRDAPVASGNGVELYVADLVPGSSTVPADPPTFTGELPMNEPISLRLVYLAEEAADGDDLVIIWARDGQELRRSRIVLRPGRAAGSAVLSGTQTDAPGTYHVDVLVEDTPLTAVRFDVVAEAAS